MRRFLTPLVVITVMLLGLVMTESMSTTAQEATPAAIPPVLVAWSEPWDALDAEAIAALYTEDGVMEDVPAGIEARGRDEIAAAFGGVMAGIAESRNEPISGFRAGDMAVMEYEVTAVDAASGQEFTFRGALIAELDGDLIRHSREYYDVATILGQLDMLDMGEATPKATPAA
jgi:uncharacterized protein (TIGR02246 family)